MDEILQKNEQKTVPVAENQMLASAMKEGAVLPRSSKQHGDCHATKEELLAKKKNPLEIDDDCPICRRRGVLCEVGAHLSVSSYAGSTENARPGPLSMSSVGDALPDAVMDLESKTCKGSASDFASSNGKAFSGFGLMNHCPFYDPTDVEEDSRTTKLFSHFSRTSEEIDRMLGANTVIETSRKLAKTIAVHNDLSKVSETKVAVSSVGKDRTVQTHHLNLMRDILSYGKVKLVTSTNSSGPTLKQLDCSVGIANSGSIPDGTLEDEKANPSGIVEVKHNTDTPAEGLRQGAAEGTNLAVTQLSRGVDADDVVVPIVGSNGYLMQFGAVFLLKPSFPVFVVISHVLDLTLDASLVEAARLLCCIKILLSRKLVPTAGENIIQQMKLSAAVYHCKPLRCFFASTGNIQSSLYHFFKVMAHLHRSECRKLVVFPICVREFEDEPHETMIVFPKLGKEYKIGLPDSAQLRISFVEKLDIAMALIHQAGVVHMDLYLSNIMWRELSESEVQLKIIDWDAAHFTHESLTTQTQQRLRPRRELVMEKAALRDDQTLRNSKDMMEYYDVSLLRVLEENLNEESLRAREKTALDHAFVEAQERFIAKA